MSDRDKTTHSDVPQGGTGQQNDRENRANQDAVSRPGVDADNGMDASGRVTDQPHEGSTFQPLEMQQDEPADRDPGLSTGQNGYVDQQGAAQRQAGQEQAGQDQAGGDIAGYGSSHEGVSRGGAVTQHGDAIRESQSAPGGGSVFQPLEADPRNLETTEDDKQRGNPPGQNQQGLNQGNPDEDGQGRREPGEPRTAASGQNQRRP